MLSVGSLFSGIGGIDLGLERTGGFRTAWFSEIDPYASRVLAHHWPQVPNLGDVTKISRPPVVDVIAGGFPCQDISWAGRGAGIRGARSGLWSHYARIIGEVRPRFVLVENVPALTHRGLDRVLGDLASIGYDAEWDCVAAAHVNAPHRRYRLFLVAYPNRSGHVHGQPQVFTTKAWQPARGQPVARGSPLADALRHGRIPRAQLLRPAGEPNPAGGREAVPDSGIDGLEGRAAQATIGRGRPWTIEPDVGRVAHGVPARVDRIRTLGNAVVPQVAEYVGRLILEAEGA